MPSKTATAFRILRAIAVLGAVPIAWILFSDAGEIRQLWIVFGAIFFYQSWWNDKLENQIQELKLLVHSEQRRLDATDAAAQDACSYIDDLRFKASMDALDASDRA